MSSVIICRRSLLAAAILCVLLVQQNVVAQSSFLNMFRKKQTLSASELQLEAKHGPWMILATTLSGDDAEQKAYALANEIRNKLRLPAFVMHKTSSDNAVLGTGQRIRTDGRSGQMVQNKLKLKYANSSTLDAYAVLVGEFTSTNDPRFDNALNAVRVAQPIALGATDTKDASEKDPNWLVKNTRALFWWQSSRNDNLQKGPMGAAFKTRNPLLPAEYFQDAPTLDSFVTSLNKQVKHSLLDCKGRFTVRVASFYGQSATDFSGGQRFKLDKTSDSLDVAAQQANKLTLALRKQGAEAYQFHDRYGSYVTVGSFEDIGKNDANNQFQYNPAMVSVMNKYCGYQYLDVRDPRTGGITKKQSLKSLEKIPFDVEGKPISVPKPQANGIYSGSLLGRK